MEDSRSRGGGGGAAAAAGKSAYADVFRGPPRFAAPFASRLGEYAEIFGDLAGSCSIPFLDLPPALGGCDVAPVRARDAGFDYSEVFGGLDSGESASSYEELFAAPKRKGTCSSNARTAEEATYSQQLMEELNFPPRDSHEGHMACKEGDRFSSNSSSSDIGSTQFSVSYNKISQGSKEHATSGKAHIMQLHALPAFSFVVDTDVSFQTIGGDGPNMLNNGKDIGKHQKKFPATSSSKGSKDSNTYLKADLECSTNKYPVSENGCANTSHHSRSSGSSLPSGDSKTYLKADQECSTNKYQVSEKDSKTYLKADQECSTNKYPVSENGCANPSHHSCSSGSSLPSGDSKTYLKADQECSTNKYPVSEMDSKTYLKADQECSTNKYPVSENGCANTSHHSCSSGSSLLSGDVLFSETMYLTLSDINLHTQPLRVPPPSRPPPMSFDTQGHSRPRISSRMKIGLDEVSLLKQVANQKDFRVRQEVVKDNSPSFLDVQVDVSSAAAAAVKEAMELAQAKLKSAKELMAKKHDSLQNCKKLGNRENTKHNEEKLGQSFFDEMLVSSAKRNKVMSAAKLAPHYKEKQNVILTEEDGQTRQGNDFRSSKLLNKPADKSEKWKTNKKYHELVNTEKYKMNEEVSEMEDCMTKTNIMTMISEAKENKSANDALPWDSEDNSKSSNDNAGPLACGHEENANLEAHDSHVEEVENPGEVHKFLVQEVTKAPYACEKALSFTGSEKKMEPSDHCKLHYSDDVKGENGKLEAAVQAVEGENSFKFVKINQIKEEKGNSEAANPIGEDYEKEINSVNIVTEPSKDEGKLNMTSATAVQEEMEIRVPLGLCISKGEGTEAACKCIDPKKTEREEKHTEAENVNQLEQTMAVHEQEKGEELHMKEQSCLSAEDELRLKLEQEADKLEEGLKKGKSSAGATSLERQEKLVKATSSCWQEGQLELQQRDMKENAIPEPYNLESFEGQNKYEKGLQVCRNEDIIEIQVEPYVMDKIISTNAVPVFFKRPLNMTLDDQPANFSEKEGNAEIPYLSLVSMESQPVASQNIFLDIKRTEETEKEIMEEKEEQMEELAGKLEEEKEKERIQEDEKEKTRLLEEENGQERKLVEKKESVWKEEKDRENKLEEEEEQTRLLEVKERERKLKEEKERARLLEETKEMEKKLEEEEQARLLKDAKQREAKLEEERARLLEEAIDRERKMEEEQARLSEEAKEREKKSEEEKARARLSEAKERERKLEGERQRARFLEEEKEREREREKDRLAVERTTCEAHEGAFAEARERAERIAIERVNSEARQRALNEAQEKAEKASSEALEKSLIEKVSREARLRAERAAVLRATAEARERAVVRALAEKAAADAKERAERYNAASRDGTRRENVSEEHLNARDKDSSHDPQFQSIGSSSHQANSDSNDQQKKFGEGESALRCKARLERHERIAERAAKALAEKNMRDILAQREQAERNRLADYLDADIKRWSNGKEGNLRALLSTLQYILGPESGWQPIPLTEIITASAVKKAYRKATLCVHPDKLQQRGASIQQKYICEKVFDLLKEAWNRFNSEER